MIIINKYTDIHTKKTSYMLHYIKGSKIVNSTDKLTESLFKQMQGNLLKGHKDIILFNVYRASDLNAIVINDINLI